MPGSSFRDGESILFTDNVDFSGDAVPEPKITTAGQLIIGTGASPAVPGTDPAIKIGQLTSSTIAFSYSDPNIVGDLTVSGVGETTVTLGSGTASIKSPRVARFVVDPTAANGTHTTIASALADADAKDVIAIRPGTYTEDFTVDKAVNFVGIGANNINASVVINGKISQSFTGSPTYENIRFTTNGDDILAFTGSGTQQTNFHNCSFFLSDGDLLTINNSSSAPSFRNCHLHQTANSLDFYNVTACGTLVFYNCRTFNSGVTPGISTIASGTVRMIQTGTQEHRFTTSGAANFQAFDCRFQGNGNNIVLLTTAGTGANHELFDCEFRSGTAAAISIGSGTTCTIGAIEISSTNANPVTGAGTITYGSVTSSSSGAGIDTTTRTGYYVQSGHFRAQSGSTSDAAYSFTGDPDTGLVRNSADNVSIVCGGGAIQTWNANLAQSQKLFQFYSGITINTTSPGAYPYTVLDASDYVVLVDTSTTRTINLPNSSTTGRIYIIKDDTGSAATNNISVTTPGGSVTIDGQTTYTMSADYASLTVIFDGSNYFVL